MNKQPINIFEFPSNLGLKKTQHEDEPGVKFLPAWLKKYGFYDKLKPQQVFRIEPPPYAMEQDEETGVRNTDHIIKYAKQQASILSEHFNNNTFNVILGGDCSILIGNAIALKQAGKFGLFYLDGHTDFMLPALSVTGGAAGMDLAIVTGHGHNKLTNTYNLQPYFDEETVWCVGNREYDTDYVQPILNSKINYYDLQKLRKEGIETCISRFLRMISRKKLNGFFIHLDADVLNDDIMPAVDSREKGGLQYEELNAILDYLLESPKARGIEITIIDPTLDKEGKYTSEFIFNVGNSISNAKNKNQLTM